MVKLRARVTFLIGYNKKTPSRAFLGLVGFLVLIKGIARSNSEYKSIDYD